MVSESTFIGQKKYIEIIPVTPNVVFACLKDCTVISAEDESIKYNLMVYDQNTGGMCTDELLNFQIESNDGWSSSQSQKYSYTSFRFSAGFEKIEEHRIRKRYLIITMVKHYRLRWITLKDVLFDLITKNKMLSHLYVHTYNLYFIVN